MDTYRKKAVIILFSLLFVFFLISLFSYIQLKRMIPIFNIGLSYYAEDIMILSLSVLSMLKVVHEIYRIEHHHEYKRRIKKTILE